MATVGLETRILEIIRRTKNVKSFRFEAKASPHFKAGQFMSVTIPVEGEEKTKYFSISNSPTEKGYLEFTKRITESPFSRTLDNLKPGDRAILRFPLGTFTLKDESEKLAFLSGGIGITPIRSMCKFATDKRLETNIILLYGNNKEEDIIFGRDFEEMEKRNKNLKVVHTLTAPDIDKNKWHGRTGYIDGQMIKDTIADYAERIFYICGPPGMVSGLTNILKTALDIREDRIRLENFAGYA